MLRCAFGRNGVKHVDHQQGTGGGWERIAGRSAAEFFVLNSKVRTVWCVWLVCLIDAEPQFSNLLPLQHSDIPPSVLGRWILTCSFAYPYSCGPRWTECSWVNDINDDMSRSFFNGGPRTSFLVWWRARLWGVHTRLCRLTAGLSLGSFKQSHTRWIDGGRRYDISLVWHPWCSWLSTCTIFLALIALSLSLSNLVY